MPHTPPGTGVVSAMTTLALPEDLREAWEAVIAGSHCERMTRALYRVALGESYREAAKAEEYADHKDVWNLAKRYGLVQAKKEQILNGTRRVALLSNEELERRLVEQTDDISTRDLIVAGGVAQDKLAAAERKSGEEPSTGGLAELVTRLKEAGVSLEITVKTPDPVLEARAREEIDVTPD